MYFTSLLLVVCGTRKGRSKINEHYLISYICSDWLYWVHTFFRIYPRYFRVTFNYLRKYWCHGFFSMHKQTLCRPMLFTHLRPVHLHSSGEIGWEVPEQIQLNVWKSEHPTRVVQIKLNFLNIFIDFWDL